MSGGNWPNDPERIRQIETEIRDIRHSLNNSMQSFMAVIAELRQTTTILTERDKHRDAMLTESARSRDAQLDGIKSDIKEIKANMVTKDQNWPSRIMAIGAIVAAILGIGGFVVAGWSRWIG